MHAMDLDPLHLPDRIGAYQLLRVIGRGGMGVVCLATKPGLVKPCAFKVLLPEHSRNPQYRHRFLREAQILSTLRHSRIVTVIEVGEADGFLFIAMDYIDGVNLRALCQKLAAQGRRLPVVVVGYIIGEVLEGLRHAHTRTIGGVLRGVIHRDVTPDNVMISSEGEVFLSDFGIARFGADGSAEIFGKLQYMAPEQGHGSATYRSDLWSACGVLHYMLTGEPPRHALGWSDFQANTHPPVPPTRRTDVPEPLERLRAAGLEPDPGKRLATARDGLLMLESWLGYRKATTALAEIHASVIGPPHSGMTNLVPVAASAQASTPPKPARTRRANPPSRVVEPEPSARADETTDDDARPSTWRRRWWRGGGDDADDADDVEEQRTTQFVEADAPRVFRRKRVVPAADVPPKLDATVELPPVAQPQDEGQHPTPPLDPAALASVLGVAESPRPEPTPAAARPERHAAVQTAPASPLAAPDRRAASRTKAPLTSPPGRVIGLAIGFAVVGLALVLGLVKTCHGPGASSRPTEPAAEAR